MRFGIRSPLTLWTTDGEPIRVPEREVLDADTFLAAFRDGAQPGLERAA